MADIIIVGGGIIGMMVARELAAAGARVTLMERGELGREASWAGGGILSPLYPWRYPDPVNVLCQWGQDEFPRLAHALIEETGVDPEWTRSGLLVMDDAESELAKAWIQRWGVAVDCIDGQLLAKQELCLASFTGRVQLWPDVAQIRNPRLLRALAHSLKASNVTLRTQQAVTEVLHRNGKVNGVRVGHDVFAADTVVITAGAWSSGVLGSLSGERVVTPVRGQMLLFRAPPELLRHMILLDGHYLVPRRDGRILAGSTVEYVGFDKATTAAAYQTLHDAAVALVPALGGCTVERHWAGLRPGTDNGIPLIGAHPRCEGLYINAGHFRNGLLAAPASARLLADIIRKRAPVVDPAPYRVPFGLANGV